MLLDLLDQVNINGQPVEHSIEAGHFEKFCLPKVLHFATLILEHISFLVAWLWRRESILCSCKVNSWRWARRNIPREFYGLLSLLIPDQRTFHRQDWRGSEQQVEWFMQGGKTGSMRNIVFQLCQHFSLDHRCFFSKTGKYLPESCDFK